MTNLRISAGMQARRNDVIRARAARDTAREAAARVVAAYHAGKTPIEKVHAAEATTDEAEARLTAARKAYADARTDYEPRFLESLSPLADSFRSNLLAIADKLTEVASPALDADAFSTAHSLPSPRIVTSARRIASVVSELRRLANG